MLIIIQIHYNFLFFIKKNYSNPTSNKPAPVYSNKVMNNNNGRPSNEINKYPASKPTYGNIIYLIKYLIFNRKVRFS